MRRMTDRAIRSHDDLLEIFEASCHEEQALGVESEKFGVYAATLAPLTYEGPRGVLGIFEALCREHGYRPLHESEGGPIVAVERVGADGKSSQVTLEPGAQFELSGAILATVHEAEEELARHLGELEPIVRALGVRWLGVGYHPLASQAELPWVPKARYPIMREYFPTRGGRGLDMMRRTATVQVNVDFASEADALRKLRVGLLLSPIVQAMFANSPFSEGKPTGRKSERAAVWLDADPDRTGLLPRMCAPGARFHDYAAWALDAPMYLFKREGRVFANTGQTFKNFLADGFEGERATVGDWKMHLGTLFPEARLKTTIELRSVDSLPRSLYCALPALWAGLLYDAEALAGAEELALSTLEPGALEAARPDIARLALSANACDRPVRALAERLVELAEGGLSRRARLDAEGRDERRHLASLGALVSRGQCPADVLVAGLDVTVAPESLRAEIARRCAI